MSGLKAISTRSILFNILYFSPNENPIPFKKAFFFLPLNLRCTLLLPQGLVQLIEEISKLEPYGMGNPKPLFMISLQPRVFRGSRYIYFRR